MAYLYRDDDFSIVYQLESRDAPTWEQWNINILSVVRTSEVGTNARL